VRVAIASAFACGVGVYRRLVDEGCNVLLWRGTEKAGSPELLYSHRKVGLNIVPLCDSWHELLAWAKAGMVSGEPTIMLFDSSGLGRFADDARRAGVHVVGGGGFMDRLEKDRGFGANVANQAGMLAPSVVEFKSLDATLDYARSGKLDRPVYWKTDTYIDGDATHKADDADELIEYLSWIKTRARNEIHNVLQDKLDGVALSTGRWWNGRAWVGPYLYTFERKKFMAGEIGPSTGCSLNAVGFYEDEDPLIAQATHWDALTPLFLGREAPVGWYDVNAIVAKDEAYFLEWTPRFGWDSEGTSLTLLYENLSTWLWYVATGQGDGGGTKPGIGFSIRLSVPPAPWEYGERDERGSAVGIPVRGDVGDLWSKGFVGYELAWEQDLGLHVAAPEGLVGLSAAYGDAVSDLAEQTLSFAKERLRVPGLMFRNDAGEAVTEDAEKACAEGFDDLHEGLWC
jgi:phosphoribosylamine--glycine ligase